MINKIYIYDVFFELIKKGVFVYNMCICYYNILVYKMFDKIDIEIYLKWKIIKNFISCII